MVKIQCLIFIILTICGLYQQANAQNNKKLHKIIKDKPSVFITFDRVGEQEPLFEGEGKERIWLRIYNNTKLNLFFCTFSVNKKYGDIGLFYEVERFSFSQEYKNEKTPDGNGKIDTCDVYTLSSGKSLTFSLSAEHLKKGLLIKTKFYYGWTGDWKEDIYEGTTHFVSFGNDQLPSK